MLEAIALLFAVSVILSVGGLTLVYLRYGFPEDIVIEH